MQKLLERPSRSQLVGWLVGWLGVLLAKVGWLELDGVDWLELVGWLISWLVI